MNRIPNGYGEGVISLVMGSRKRRLERAVAAEEECKRWGWDIPMATDSAYASKWREDGIL
jgi:hypothetical protein